MVSLHPLELVYSMDAVFTDALPVLVAVTTPELFTVARFPLSETQGEIALGVPDSVSVMLPPWQTLSGPVIVGCGLIVTLAWVENEAQPEEAGTK
jgi:hypothetical protein